MTGVSKLMMKVKNQKFAAPIPTVTPAYAHASIHSGIFKERGLPLMLTGNISLFTTQGSVL